MKTASKARSKRAPRRREPPRIHVAAGLAYARGVVSGRIPACKWVKLACRRHVDDLTRAKTRAFHFRFDPETAERACQFAELFPHVKGHWAIPESGIPGANQLRLEPWQCFIRSAVFGWLEKATELRRFRVAYIEVPRKNGKSILAAVDGLMMFAADGEYGSEVYSGATTEKQAWEVFRPAKQMAERTPAFLEAYGVRVNAKGLVILANGSRFEPVIGKPGDGSSPSHAIVDEYHEHLDSTLYDTMRTGMGARRQPLMEVITTAGTDLGGPCYALHEEVQSMLKGTIPNDRLFGIIYTIDEKDDWTSEAAIRKANPNYGVSAGAEFLKSQLREAINDSRKQSVFKTKHLNVWVTARDAWMNMEWWNRQADPALRAEDFAGLPCYIGVDLSSKLDLTAAVRVFRRDQDGQPHYYVFGRHYVPRATVDDPANRHYQGWAEDGVLVATEGANPTRIDLDRVLTDLKDDARAQGCDEVAYDEWSAVTMEKELGGEGLVLVAIPQNVKHFSDPMKYVEAMVKSGQLHHDGNPCLSWQLSNVTAREDANENVYPRKERKENKIDGAVALIMAMGRAVIHYRPPSVYEERGAEVFG